MSTTARSRTRRSESVAATVAVTLLLALTAAVPASAAPDDGSITIALRPDRDDDPDDPRSSHYVVAQADAGDELIRTVVATNAGTEPMTVELYVGGAAVTSDGFVLDDRDDADLARWSRTSPGELELAAGASAAATVSVAIPDDATDGERYGVVWAQVRGAATGGRDVVHRVGVRMFVLVGAGETDLRVDRMTPRRDNGAIGAVEITVTNRGDRAVDVRGTLRLEDDIHAEDPVATIAGGPTIAPGATEVIVARFDRGPPNGPWDASVDLDVNGRRRRARAQEPLTFPAGADQRGDAVPTTMVTEDGVGVVPVAIAVLALVVALLATWRVRRR